MKKLMSVILAPVLFLFITGCSTLEMTGGKTVVSAIGGPGVVLSKLADLHMTGSLQTTPGGFTLRNTDPGIGVISNERDGVSKDVDIYVRSPSMGNNYVLYNGPAEVRTPGWVKVYNKKTQKWEKRDTPRWLKVSGLESIHFESPLVQSVTLHLRLPSNEALEVKFNTLGRKQWGGTYKRINILFIRLPKDRYRLKVYSYTGKGIFKSANRRPYTRTIYMDNDPTDTRVGNTLIGWKKRL